MGRSPEEQRRLIRHAQLQQTATLRLLEEAGITTDMQVLDIGTGAGDVALLAAELVGAAGSVMGVDIDAALLQTARVRAQAAGLTNIRFIEGDLREHHITGEFDAIVGRRVLMHLPDPAQMVRSFVRCLRVGGVVAFYESDFTIGPVAVPPVPIHAQWRHWQTQVLVRAGVETSMGSQLYRLLLAAGLEEPQLRLEATLGGGPDFGLYAGAAEALRILLPKLIETGVATADDVHVDTFEERFRQAVAELGAVVMAGTSVAAW